jgi:hypothetical protein
MSSESVPNTYVILFEKNTKEGETFVYYLQWNNNEEKLKLLEKILNKADYDHINGDDIVILSLSTDVQITEHAVNQHCAVKHDVNGYYNMFSKYNGVFKCPFEEDDIECDGFTIADKSQTIFYSCNIHKMFH